MLFFNNIAVLIFNYFIFFVCSRYCDSIFCSVILINSPYIIFAISLLLLQVVHSVSLTSALLDPPTLIASGLTFASCGDILIFTQYLSAAAGYIWVSTICYFTFKVYHDQSRGFFHFIY